MEKKLQSFFWMLLWSCSFSGAMALTRFLSLQSQASPWGSLLNTVWIRSLLGTGLFVGFFLRYARNQRRWKSPQTSWSSHIVRGMLIALAMGCTYGSYRYLPLATASALGMTSPLFLNLLSVFFLKERIPRERWFALALGYGGVLCLVQARGIGLQWPILLPLVGNICSSLNLILTKRLSLWEKNQVLLFYGSFFPLVFSSLGLGLCRYPFSWESLFSLYSLVGVMGAFSQWFYLRALEATSPGFASSFENLRLVIFLPLGYFLFQESVNLVSAVGIGLILWSVAWLGLGKGRNKA